MFISVRSTSTGFHAYFGSQTLSGFQILFGSHHSNGFHDIFGSQILTGLIQLWPPELPNNVGNIIRNNIMDFIVYLARIL